jgi:hypothetical protein
MERVKCGAQFTARNSYYKEDASTACCLTQITPVGISFLSDVILIYTYFYWGEFYKLECVYKMFTSHSV